MGTSNNIIKKDFTAMRDLRGYLNSDERRAIFNAADNDRDRLLIKMLELTGRRINEILPIRIADIDFNDNSIIFHIEKKFKFKKDEEGNKIKKVHGKGKYETNKVDYQVIKRISKPLIKCIDEYRKEYNLSKEDYLFPSPYNYQEKKVNGIITKFPVPLSRQRAFQIIRKCGEKSGINLVGSKRLHPHHFRHSIAIDLSKAMKSPADLRKVQKFLEHSTINVTEQYLQFGDDEISDMLDKLGEKSFKDIE